MTIEKAPTVATKSGAVGKGPILELKDLHVTFANEEAPVRAVRGIDLSVGANSCLVVVGESGSGKSVTARAITGLLPERTSNVQGSIRFQGRELVDLRESEWKSVRGDGIGIVFQDPMRSLNPTMRVGVQIAEGIKLHRERSRRQLRDEVIELLDHVGIPSPAERYHDYPHQMSGGMRQRVMTAIAIACRPKILIADEATTALDVTTQAQIMELLRRLQRELDMTLILITHDMGLAFTYGDEIAVMYAGRVVEHATATELSEHVRMPYTRGLLESVPRLTDDPHSRFLAIEGRPPDARHLPQGCAFAPRCPIAQSVCREKEPELEGIGHEFACWYPL